VTACNKAGSVLGEKSAMVAHILGGERPCRNASQAAKTEAEKIRKELQKKKASKERKRSSRDDGSEDGEGDGEDDTTGTVPTSKRRKIIDRVEMKQSTLDAKVYKGINIPFTPEQTKAIHTQFLRATVSANLPFQWVENPEVVKLFIMFRALAGEVIPSAKMLSGRLLDEENERVDKKVKETVKGKDVVLTCVCSLIEELRKPLTYLNFPAVTE
jgi:hypothetical protein